jgi:peptidoglycan/LPS O-acetylase OafA/YrhL
VLAVHWTTSGRHPVSDGMALIWGQFSGKGALGVSSFFVVSGFLITRVLAGGPGGLFRPDLRVFYTRRVARLAPLLVLTVAAGLALAGGVSGPALRFCVNATGAPLPASLFASIATFTFNWRRIVGPIHGYGLHWDVLWSLSVEEQFYLLYPVSLIFLRRRRNLAVFSVFWVVVGTLARVIAFNAHPRDFLWVYTNTFGCFDQLAYGILLSLAVDRYGRVLSRRTALSAGLCAAGAALAAYAYISIASVADLVWAPGVLAFGVAVSILGGLHLPLFDGAFVSALGLPGRLSYGMYLLQGLVLYALWDILQPLGALGGYAVYCAVTIAVGYGVFHAYEAPSNRWVRKVLA